MESVMRLLYVLDHEANIRLDVFLTDRLPELSRSHIQKLMVTHSVTVNGAIGKPGYKTKAGDKVEIDIPPARPLTTVEPEDIPIDVIYEDADLIVVNKAKGVVVHPAPGAETGTLVHALLAHCKDLSGIGGVLRPGIVHRLDKDTSGLLVVAKNDSAHISLSEQIRLRVAVRKYQALLWGRVPFHHAVIDAPIARHPVDRKRMTVYEDFESSNHYPQRQIDHRTPHRTIRPAGTGEAEGVVSDLGSAGEKEDPTPHAGRPAITEIRLLEHLGVFSWIEAILQTGRTHQIRVHAAFAGYPVVGDTTYGGSRRVSADELRGPLLHELNDRLRNLHGQMLHAYFLQFNHPRTGQRMQFHAPLPAEIADMVEFLRRIGES
jgi:23S rRNA pseudouridine1911/1915/1917 synthase